MYFHGHAARIFTLFSILLTLCCGTANALGPLTVDPAKPRYFIDSSGRAVYLSGAHLNNNLIDRSDTRILDFSAYLDFLQRHNLNFVRLWAWEQAAWTHENAQKVEFEPLPYQRTGPGNALDGKVKFDLTRFDQAYFERLRSRVAAAQARGIYVSVMLFQGFSSEPKTAGANPWPGHPFHRDNNINGIDGDPSGNGSGEEVHLLTVPAITKLQEDYVRKVIDTLNGFDNVLYEICGEAPVLSKDWQYHMIDYIKSYQKTKPYRQPVGLSYFYRGTAQELFDSPADWVLLSGNNANPPLAAADKVIVQDMDLGLLNTPAPWQWVWKSFTRGYNPIYMDSDPFNPDLNAQLRAVFGSAATTSQLLDLSSMAPSSNACSSHYCLVNPGLQYLVYVPAGGPITIDLSAGKGNFTPNWFSPLTGQNFSASTVRGGGKVVLTPPFQGEAVLYLVRESQTPPSQTASQGLTVINPPTSKTVAAPARSNASSTMETTARRAGWTSPFDFSLSNDGNKSVDAGSTVTNSIRATLSSGRTERISFSVSGLPSGATASFSTNGCSPTCSRVLTVKTSAATPAGSFPITVAASGGEVNRTTSFTLLIGLPTVAPPVTGGQGLVAHWKFDEGTGTSAADASGNGNTATLVNGPLWSAGIVGKALYFDGIDDTLVVPNASSLNLAGSFTLSAWVNPASTFTDFRSILVKNYRYYLYASVAGYCGDGNPLGGFWESTDHSVCQASPLPANSWSHLALTYDGATLTLYRNGLAVASQPTSGALSSTTETLQIGASQYGEYFAGLIDEVRIYNRAQTATEIQAAYQQELGRTPTTPTTVAAPTITPNGGNFTGSIAVIMQTATSGASIYYTTDGSTPTQASSLYSGAMNVTTNTVLKAIAFKTGNNPSAETSASFTITPTIIPGGNAYYVATDGNDANPGTIIQPFRTIAKGLSVLHASDKLYIRSGTYAESINSNNQTIPTGTSWNDAPLISAYPGETVVLRPSGVGEVVNLAHSYIQYVTFSGLTLDAINAGFGVSGWGGARYVRFQDGVIKSASKSGVLLAHGNGFSSDYFEFINMKIHDNGLSLYDHGVYIGTSNNLVERCDIYNNVGYGIHVYNGSGNEHANNNILRANTVHNNALVDVSSAGIILSSGDGNLAYNNIIQNNSYGISVNYRATNSKIYNNVVYANTYYGIDVGGGSAAAVVKNNIIYRNGWTIANAGSETVMSNNMMTDPGFVNPSGNDFRLQSGSPAIDAGAPLAEVTTDFRGLARPQRVAYDIGAYESE